LTLLEVVSHSLSPANQSDWRWTPPANQLDWRWDSSCQSIRLEIDSSCQSAVDLNFEDSRPRANQLLANVRVQAHSRGTRAGWHGGLAMQTSLGWRTIALYSAKSSHERYSNSILFRFLQKKKKIVFLINKS